MERCNVAPARAWAAREPRRTETGRRQVPEIGL